MTLRVLYAEDNSQDADLTRFHFLNNAPDIELTLVATGAECLTQIERREPDLLLLDHRLPDREGLDILVHLTRREVQVPVILVTGVGDEKLVITALRLGASNYVPKAGSYLESLPGIIRATVKEYRQKLADGLLVRATRRIFYIDHSPTDIDLTLRHFARVAPQFEVETAFTCSQALAKLSEPRYFDLLLVDLRMPDMSGLEFVRLAKAMLADRMPPFIVISGRGDDAAAIATLQMGAADYVAKRDGYLEQVPHTIEHAIDAQRVSRLNIRLRAELAERRRAEAELHASHSRLQALWAIMESNDSAVSGQQIVSLLAQMTGSRYAFYGLASSESDTIDAFVWNSGRPFSSQIPVAQLHDAFGALAQAMREREPQVVNQVESDSPTFDLAPPDTVQRYLLVPHAGRSGLYLALVANRASDYGPTDIHQISAFLHGVQAIADRLEGQQLLRHSQERLLEAQRLARLGHWEFDLQSRQFSGSEMMQTLLGLPLESPLSEAHLAGACSPEEGQHLLRLHQQCCETGQPYQAEVSLIFPPGQARTLAFVGGGVRDGEGRLTGVRGTIQDVSERKRAEQQRAELLDQLRATQRMDSIGALAGGIAHDFNNLLTVIMAHSDFALERLSADDPIRQDLQEIQKAGRTAEALTRQLLAFGRRQELQLQPYDLNQGLSGLESMLRRLIGSQIELEITLDPELHSTMADASQMDQLIVNLVINARDAMPNGGLLRLASSRATVTPDFSLTHEGLRPGEHVVLTVSDSGSGMDLETRSRIFEPFYTTKATGKGTGLGLSIVYGVVRQSGGAVEVRSEPGHGTVFQVYLPAAIEQQREEAVSPEAATDLAPTILVVDDQEQLRRLVDKILQSGGFSVLVADGGEQALAICRERQGKIDLLLTDVIMPGLNGNQLADRVVAQWPKIGVVFMSGHDHNLIDNSSDVHFISKPFKPKALIEIVQAALQRRPEEQSRTRPSPPAGGHRESEERSQ